MFQFFASGGLLPFLVLMAAGSLAALLVAFAARRMLHRDHPVSRRLNGMLRRPPRWIGHIMEPVILLPLLFVAGTGPFLTYSLLGASEDPRFTLYNLSFSPDHLPSQPFMGFAKMSAFIVGGVLLLSRLIRGRIPFLILTAMWFLGLFWLIYTRHTRPVLETISAEMPPDILTAELYIPFSFLLVRNAVWFFLTLLAALWAVRHRFTWTRFLAGGFLGDLLAYWFLSPFWAAESPIGISFFYPLVAAMLILLPIQRQAMERLTGIRLRRDPALEQANLSRWSATQSALLHGGLIALAGLTVFSAFVNYFEARQWKALTQGPLPLYRDPGLHNAYAELRQRFTKTPHNTLNGSNASAIYSNWVELDSTTATATAQFWTDKNTASVRTLTSEFAPYISDYLAAAEKGDYIELPGAAMLSLLHLREVSRALFLRSMLALHEKRPADALRDLESMIRMGSMLNDAPVMVPQMIGAAIRGIGLQAAGEYFQVERENPENLRALANTLSELGPHYRRSLNILALRRGETGFMDPVVPNMEVAVPAMRRALYNSQTTWANFDLLGLATALELHRHETGGYPERLDDLVPLWTRRIPLDPITGKPYIYTRDPKGSYRLTIDPASIPDFAHDKGFMQFLEFPVPRPREAQP